jgi:glucosyl-dolichyl phosphate glucuronosyltransferase
MSSPVDISIVISTFNRCDLLPSALESLLAQQAGEVRYEVVVVDNNSTDRTREVVESFAARGDGLVRYVFEGQQGLSHGRNTGVGSARAPIVVFTDDDVRASPDWVRAIKRVMDSHPEVDYAGGKILPEWPSPPPAWLTHEHWAPLAITDYGDEPFHVDASYPICLIGASLAVRRSLFDRVGLFGAAFQRVKDSVGSVEDHEWQVRAWHGGARGLYAPDIVVTAAVQPDRMTKAYHRRWHSGHGRYEAMLNARHGSLPLGGANTDARGLVMLYGTPAYVYRTLLGAATQYVACALRGHQSASFRHETTVRALAGYIRYNHEYVWKSAGPSRSAIAELAAFARALVRKKLRS